MLTAGTVVRVPVDFKQGEPKYLVVVDVDSAVHCVVINSKIHKLFGGELFKDSFVPIEKATHPFMEKDVSYVDCNEIKQFPLAEIQTHIAAEPGCVRGQISSELRAKIIHAVQVSICIVPADKRRYIAVLSSRTATDAPDRN